MEKQPACKKKKKKHEMFYRLQKGRQKHKLFCRWKTQNVYEMAKLKLQINH